MCILSQGIPIAQYFLSCTERTHAHCTHPLAHAATPLHSHPRYIITPLPLYGHSHTHRDIRIRIYICIHNSYVHIHISHHIRIHIHAFPFSCTRTSTSIIHTSPSTSTYIHIHTRNTHARAARPLPSPEAEEGLKNVLRERHSERNKKIQQFILFLSRVRTPGDLYLIEVWAMLSHSQSLVWRQIFQLDFLCSLFSRTSLVLMPYFIRHYNH